MTGQPAGWQFWIDRGGTFTDVVARRPDGSIITHKLLSENPRQYSDAAVAGIRSVLDLGVDDKLPQGLVDSVKMGTTVATNALLERQGEPTLLVVTRGFADALRIGYQARPELFALDIVLPEMLYSEVVEIDERVGARGELLTPLDLEQARTDLTRAQESGLSSVAIALTHGYRYTDHEKQLASLAEEIGFTQVSVSHEVSPLMKLVSRGDTTVVDAYLSPVLRRYVNQVEEQLSAGEHNGDAPLLMFMQSNGGLTDARHFQGKDALLSGPAGGVVGMVATAGEAGFDRLIGFDMGGTSTDVSHYGGELERTYETEVAGVRVRAPMMLIHTVAAGGGSIVHFDGARMRVGPDSAGADPGPACYGNGGPLTITDCNVMLGRLRPEFFPAVFGPGGDQPLDVEVVHRLFEALTQEVADATGRPAAAENLAEGFLTIAVENMANAIKKISVQRGHDVTDYVLVCFGGAGGQHACLVADRLGIEKVLVHPYAGVLSALGIGLADVRTVNDESVESELTEATLGAVRRVVDRLRETGRATVLAQGVDDDHVESFDRVAVRYDGSDTALHVPLGAVGDVVAAFNAAHHARFGFTSPGKAMIVESAQVEVVGHSGTVATTAAPTAGAEAAPLGVFQSVMDGDTHDTPFIDREALGVGARVDGPAVIIEANSTTVLEPGWQAAVLKTGDLLISRVVPRPDQVQLGTDQADPVQLEIFNNLFMNVAEQMGLVLENTAVSVNIKERLDFSCAIFDPSGDLIANAPHMPVHLGSMSETIKSVIAQNSEPGDDQPSHMSPGDVFVLNAPYNGGTHLPDITVVKPVFEGADIIFYVASRGHHADVGGMTPGSAPANSTSVEQEGVLLNGEKLVEDGVFLEGDLRDLLATGPYPARSPDHNVADLKAQVAACEKGTIELLSVVDHYSLAVVHAYMAHVKRNAEDSVRRLIGTLNDCSFTYGTDDGHQVSVSITVDREAGSATLDFTGTSATHPGNYNAPRAVCQAAVLYVFRCMVDDDIPLNAGCMEPLKLILPEPSMISPEYPAAVIAGNVETSQLIVDTLFGALGVMAAPQGTMNNFIWGNDRYQYYETICGGAGATASRDGCDAVHTHMTNSRLTDPEVLEWRYPVVLESFSIRRGSGGSGVHRGGDGTVRRMRFNDAVTVSLLTSHREIAPYGVAGGEPGATGINLVFRADGSEERLSGTSSCEIQPGDVIQISTPGGGGFGSP
ncbi:MAG: hydantoinase B/oxoprolinase family protein [Acidimicrobiia bacterium]|nr:hydantoinase B/oxoprolinase family protein [Acidimicrobiia bacterium]